MILHDHLTAALGRAHDIGGIDRLIGGDHHKALHLIFFGKVHHVERAEDIVLDRLGRRNLHQRNMLMRRRVEHDLRMIFGKDAVHFRVVAHRRDQGNEIQAVAVLDIQLLLDVVGVILIDIHDDDLFGAVLSDLAHQLGADGTAAARNHTDLAVDKITDLLLVEGDRRSAEQILDLDVLDLREDLGRIVILEQLAQIGYRLDAAAGFGAVAHDALTLLLGAGWDREDHEVDVVLAADKRDILGESDDLHTHQLGMILRRIIVHQTYRQDHIGGVIRILLGVFDLLQDHARGITGADDQGAVIFFILKLTCLDQMHHRIAESDTEDTDHRNAQDRVQRHELYCRGFAHQVHKQKAESQAEHDRQAAQGDIARLEVAPHLVIRAEHKQKEEAKQHAHADHTDNTDRLYRDTHRITAGSNAVPSEQHITEQCRYRDQRRVGKHQKDFSDIHFLHNQNPFLSKL